MSLDHKELLRCCVEVLNSYDQSSVALEEHVKRYLKPQKNLDESDQTFVVEVFAGCVRYHSILRVVVDGFYNRDGKTTLRSEENLYRVMTYLVLFRLDELGVAHYRKFVRSQDINKMYKFLNFFLNEKALRTWMKDEWTKLYDNPFVQTTLLSPILRWLPELQEMLQQMQSQIENRLNQKRPSKPATEIKAFNLTKPRPRSVPIPMPIPKLKPHKPVPTTTYKDPKEVDIMAEIKEKNRRKAEERLMESSRQQFACANPELSEKTRRRLQEIMMEEDAKLDFECHKSHPVPDALLKENMPIKLNTAAILREGKLYQKREEEEIKKLEKLEAGARDASDFLEWQNRMRRQDLDNQLADIERRRLEGKLSHEEAILARQNLIQENKQKVQEMKEEASRLMQEYLEKRMQEEADMRLLVEKVMDTHENAKEAKKKLQEYKAKIVQDVTEESRELMRQALEEAEKEMKQKMELIREIRAMEATPVIRHKLVDLTETAGHGLLSEMSIAELRERLDLLKIKEAEEEESKRDDILNDKQAKDQMLMDTLDTIARHRTEQSKAAAIRLEERKKTHNTRPVPTDPKLIDLQRRLEEKREERKKQQQQAKLVPSKKSSQRLRELNNSKKLIEESRWQELEHRREKTARLASMGHRGGARMTSQGAAIATT